MSKDTNAKGKGRAVDAQDSDSDSSVDFFIMKPRAIKSLLEDVVELSDDTEDDNDDEDGEGRKKRKKKRYKRPASKSALPEWTKSSSSISRDLSKKRSFGQEKQSGGEADVVVISSDESSPKKSKGKGKETGGRSRIVLTPPPQITEAERAKWREQARQALSPPVGGVTSLDDEDDAPATLGSLLPPDSEKIYVYVSMMTDRTKLPSDASERAIKHWETRRKICIFRDGKLDMLWYAIGESWSRNPDDIVLCHAGRRIYSKLRTARELGIDDGADLTAYEKTHWDRLEREKLKEIDRITKGDAAYLSEAEEEIPKAVPTETVRKVKISLRGDWGTRKIAVPRTITGADLALTYCIKSNKDQSLAGRLRLIVDGDTIDGDDVPLESMDLDDGDMIDVEVPGE